MENIQGGNQFIERQQKAKEEREKNILEIINGTDLKENYKFDKKINQDGKLDNNIKVDFKDLDIDEQEKVLRDEKTDRMYKNFGDKLTEFLNDDSIIEINLNQDGYLWTEKFGIGREKTQFKIGARKARAILELVADYNNSEITAKSPIISSVLPHGERITGIIADSVAHCPVFAIRKRSKMRFELGYYVETGVITEEQKSYIETQIENKKNIMIVGGTSSGKTTFGNACIQHLENIEAKKGQSERIAVIEEIPELICNCSNVLRLTVYQYAEAIDLLRACMRLTPDRIIYGELRKGIEVMELLKAWNSGHDGGISTIHASSGIGALEKMEQYLGEIAGIDINSQRRLIGNSVNVVVALAKTDDFKRRVTEIVEVNGYDYDKRKYNIETIYKYTPELYIPEFGNNKQNNYDIKPLIYELNRISKNIEKIIKENNANKDILFTISGINNNIEKLKTLYI